MIRWLLAIAVVGSVITIAPGEDEVAVQTDWSGGGGVAGPVAHWGTTFESSEGVSWRQWPGRLALAASPRTDPVAHGLPGEHSGAIKVLPSDVDLDGDADLLAVSYLGDRIELLLNDGERQPGWSRMVIADELSRALAVAVADVDGDQLPDVIAGADTAAEVSWWRNLGGEPPAWERHLIDDAVPGAHDLATADLDGDLDLDVVAVSYQDDLVLWWRNDGGSPVEWTRHEIAAGFDYPTKVAIADVDRDGDADVIAVAWLDQALAWWRNDGGDPIAWSRQEIATGFAGAHWVAADDVDRDGRVDVIGAAMDLRQLAWWRNGGGEPVAWSKLVVTATLAGAVSVAAADIDGDGDTDVAGAGWHPSGGVAWWENVDSVGGSWRRHLVASDFGEASSVAVADIDGTGTLDLVASSWSLNGLAWWEVSALRPTGTLTGSVLDTGGAAAWTGCGWSADQPAGTGVVVEVRSGATLQALSPWQELGTEGPCDMLVAGSRYLQYRVLLDLASAGSSPSLEEVFFRWIPETAPAPRRATARLRP